MCGTFCGVRKKNELLKQERQRIVRVSEYDLDGDEGTWKGFLFSSTRCLRIVMTVSVELVLAVREHEHIPADRLPSRLHLGPQVSWRAPRGTTRNYVGLRAPQ